MTLSLVEVGALWYHFLVNDTQSPDEMPRFCDMRRVEVGAVWYHFLVNDTQSRWSRCSLISLFSKWHSVSWRIHLTESSLSVKSLFGYLRLELTWILTCRSQQKEGVVTECSPSQLMIDWLHLMHALRPHPHPSSPASSQNRKKARSGAPGCRGLQIGGGTD